jgi:hypothetical protein
MEVISKEEFLRACNQKIQQDNDLADEERRRREEEERIRQEEERIRQEEAERRRREAERVAQEQREWDAWYNRLPSECKNGFDYNGFRYRVNPNIRTITKQAISNDIRENRNLTQLNRELGL